MTRMRSKNIPGFAIASEQEKLAKSYAISQSCNELIKICLFYLMFLHFLKCSNAVHCCLVSPYYLPAADFCGVDISIPDNKVKVPNW